MKTLTAISLFLALCCLITAQVRPKIMLSYSNIEQYTIGRDIVVLPDLSVKTGMAYTFRRITVDFDNTIWVNDGRGASFTPTQALFECGIETVKKQFRLRLSHTCWHPVASNAKLETGIYGGSTKLSLSYGY